MTGPPLQIGGGRSSLLDGLPAPMSFPGGIISGAPVVGPPGKTISGSGAYQALLTDGLLIVQGLTGNLTITLPPGALPGLSMAIVRNDTSANGITILPPAGDTMLQQSQLQLGRFGDQLTFTRSTSGLWVWDTALGAEDYNGTPNVALAAAGPAAVLLVAIPDASRTILGFAISLNAAITGGSLAITVAVNGVQVGGTLTTLTAGSNPNGLATKTLGFVLATGPFTPGVGAGLILSLIATGAGPLTGATAATASIRLL